MLSVSVHLHPESFLTGSTLDSFIKRAKELNRTHLACTDHGYFHSSLKAYNLAKKNGLKPILGLEFYFKDISCPVVSGTPADRCRYFSATIYALDQEAYQAICRTVSKTDFQTIEIREEKQNLFTWKELEYLTQYNTHLILGGIHDIVGKAYLASNVNVGLKLFEKLNNLFKNKLSIALICEPWIKRYSQVVEIRYTDGSKDSILASDTISTDRARKAKAKDLIDRPGHVEIKSKIVNGIFTKVDKVIADVQLHKGFLPIGCDATLKINKFLKILADRYKVPVLASDYAYYATIADKIVQRVVLEGKDSIHANQHMKSMEEILDYLQKNMGLTLEEASKIVSNTNEWAKQFDNFELKYGWRLADIGENPFKQVNDIIQKVGRMKWQDSKYVSRLKEELEVIAKNPRKNLLPYFIPIHDVLNYYKENGELTGPARGSCGGSLLCYLMGITQINPFRYDLPFSRFFSLDRIMSDKLPDVDCLAANTIIKTELGDVTIENLSNLNTEMYPKIKSFNGLINIWELPILIFKKGNAKVYKYELDNGQSITCTPDHKIYVDGEWMEIDEVFRCGMDIKMPIGN